jgi:hypothetical protein
MARVARTRQRTSTFVGNWKTWSSSGTLTWNGTYTENRVSNISDYVGRPVQPSPLAASQTKGIVRLDGQYKRTNGATGTFTAYPVVFGQGDVLDVSPPSIPLGWELTTVARSNPSRPVVYPFEIVESVVQLPKMLRGLYNLLSSPRSRLTPRGVSSEYLGLQFGWLPLIDDLRKICNAQSYVEKRAKELNQLYSGKGLRRRVRFSNDTRVYARRGQTSDGTTVFTFPGSVTVTKEVWATIRWFPTSSLPFGGESDERYGAYLRRLVLGLTPEGMVLGAWKIIPWTWLIGWFTNVGDYLAVNSNTVPATYSQACLMRRVRQDYVGGTPTATNVQWHNLSLTDTQRIDQLTRVVGSGVLVPGFNMPFLDMFRLSILGSLAIQRIR